jgi:hypothetical protein
MDGVEFCQHGNMALSCHVCRGGVSGKPDKTGDPEQLEDQRCHQCDAPCKRKTSLKTWVCPVCSYRSNIEGSGADVDFRTFDTTTGVQGGRSDLQKKVNWFRNNYWQNIPRDRRDQILLKPEELSPEYSARMRDFLQFETNPELRKRKARAMGQAVRMEEQRKKEAERLKREYAREIERRKAEKERKRKAEREEGISTAMKSSDFDALLQFHIDGEDSVNKTLISILKELREKRDLRRLRRIASQVSQNSSKIRDGVLSEFFRTLFKSYPKELNHAKEGFDYWLDSRLGKAILGSVMEEIDSNEVGDLLSWPNVWEDSTGIGFLDLIISASKGEERYLLIAKELQLRGLRGDSMISYIVRRNNYLSNEDNNESSLLVKKIEDDERRIIALLTMGASDFSDLCSAEEFSEIVGSPFFSLILSADQAKSFLEEQTHENSRVEIENRIKELSNLDGIYLASILSKFKRSLSHENVHDGSYFTLENQRIQKWNLHNESELELKPSDDPFRISKSVIEQDMAISAEDRARLDSMFESHQ